jgi:branched-chain amino acid transport system substrate-binding protein
LLKRLELADWLSECFALARVLDSDGKLREDGRVIRDVHLFQVKSPAESKALRDCYRLVRAVSGDKAFRPLSESERPLVKKT